MSPGAKPRQILGLAWLAFFSAGMFFALMTPLGEGIDEPAHFAYVQHVAQTLRPPLGRVKYFSEEMKQFLEGHPVSWSFHTLHPSLPSHDAYWKRSPNERESLDRRIRELRFSGRYVEATDNVHLQYESHQPPLYYLLASPIFGAASAWLPLPETFLLTRIWSVLIASLIVPGAFFLARTVFDDAASDYVAALLVVFPGMYPGIVRVSNDALAAPLAVWLFFALAAFLKTNRPAYLYLSCVLTVAGLWTKAFFIPIVVAAVLSLLLYRKLGAATVLALTSTLGSFWYLENIRQTGSVTGLPETVLAQTSLASSAGVLWQLDWSNLLSVVRSSHIWIGNGSLLGVRSWMYQVIGWIFLLLTVGCVARPARSMARLLLPLALIYGIFAAALIYFATQVFQQTGTSVIQGWYLTILTPIEAVLCVAGARAWFAHRWNQAVSLLMVMLFVLLIYSALFVAMPYYAGITSHNASGHLTTYHPAPQDFPLMTHRLLRLHPAVPAFLPWLCLSVVAASLLYSRLWR